VREQTSYGTLRGYLAAGWQFTSDDPPTISLPGTVVPTAGGAGALGPNSNVHLLRAFIQFGGFTFGKTASFWDFFNTAKYTLQTTFLYQDFGYNIGVFTYGYTQQLGNGMAATIAVQDPTPYEHNIVDVDAAGATLLGTTAAAAAALAKCRHPGPGHCRQLPDRAGLGQRASRGHPASKPCAVVER
jgi:hypothetical protein